MYYQGVQNIGSSPKKLVRVLYDEVPEFASSDGEMAGELTSICFSPKHGKNIAFSIIPSKVEKIDDGKFLL